VLFVQQSRSQSKSQSFPCGTLLVGARFNVLFVKAVSFEQSFRGAVFVILVLSPIQKKSFARALSPLKDLLSGGAHVVAICFHSVIVVCED
jgi:hypothetical protein